MRWVAVYVAGVISALALMLGSLGGILCRLLSEEDDLDPVDDPFDAFPYTTADF